jgi:hypothetical protein
MNICLKVVGGGPAKGRGCSKFEMFVYHIYSYGLYGDRGDVVDSCVYEVRIPLRIPRKKTHISSGT